MKWIITHKEGAKLHRYRVTSAPTFPADYLELQPADNLHCALYIFTLCIRFSVMVPMQFVLKETLVERSNAAASDSHKVLFNITLWPYLRSACWTVQRLRAEGNLAERKNIGWRYSAIIQFHVHVQRGQEFSLGWAAAAPYVSAAGIHLMRLKEVKIYPGVENAFKLVHL